MNLTKTVRKAPIDLDLSEVGHAVEDSGGGGAHGPGPKYDDEDKWVSRRHPGVAGDG